MPLAARHLAAALAAALFAGCTSGSSPIVPGETDAGYSVIVGRDGIAFQPGAGDGGLVVPVDTLVHWRFATSGYNVVSGTIVDGGCVPDNQFCSGVDLDAGVVDCSQAPLQLASSRWSHSFADAGTYTYFSAPQCQGQIQGVITVR